MLVSRVGPVTALLIALGACGGASRPKVSWPDAPVELRDDGDRYQAIDSLWVIAPGAERDRARAAIASALTRKIGDTIAEDRPFTAAVLLDQLTWLWHADATQIGRGLAPHTGLLDQLRAMFAKSGALEPAIQTLVLLAEVDPARRAEHHAEIDEILKFADELAIADNGANAVRSQPISLLQPTALALPLPWLVDRYVALLVQRQAVISNLISQHGASMEIVRAHHDILSTQRRIAIVLARAGRVSEIHGRIANLKGLGADHRELVLRAEIVAEQPTGRAYADLARVLRTEDSERKGHAGDPAAALATCLAGLAKFPGDIDLLTAAAGDARTLGRIEQAIVLHEGALRGATDVDPTTALRLGKLYGERITRLAKSGRPGAAHDAWRNVLAFTSKRARQHPHTVWQQTAAIAESALGHGLASQGLVADARVALKGSLERAPSIEAYEILTAIEVQTDRFAAAQQWAAIGMGLLIEQTSGDRYQRAKLERLAGDALLGAGKREAAATHYLEGMRQWASLGEDKDLPRAIAAERKLESGRAMFRLGDTNAAVELAIGAVEVDEGAPDVLADVVAFLLEADHDRDAIDVYHRALGADIPDLYKVYMSLWIAGAAKRKGEPGDRLALDYLMSRSGDTWYELLARAATGRVKFDQVRAAATTKPRLAELAFYGATLGFDPAAATPAGKRDLLEQVVAAQVVLGAEYDLARLYLARP